MSGFQRFCTRHTLTNICTHVPTNQPPGKLSKVPKINTLTAYPNTECSTNILTILDVNSFIRTFESSHTTMAGGDECHRYSYLRLVHTHPTPTRFTHENLIVLCCRQLLLLLVYRYVFYGLRHARPTERPTQPIHHSVWFSITRSHGYAPFQNSCEQISIVGADCYRLI